MKSGLPPLYFPTHTQHAVRSAVVISLVPQRSTYVYTVAAAVEEDRTNVAVGSSEMAIPGPEGTRMCCCDR